MNLRKYRHIFSSLALAAFGLLALGSLDTQSVTQQVKSQSPSYTLDADQLRGEYDANVVAADNKYKGKVVAVSGKVQIIGKEGDSAYIVMGLGGVFNGVKCMFTQSGESAVASLSEGARVTVKGVVKGKHGHVLLRNCTIE